ncbi:hypothetical protein TL16_g00009 [Triparma laevis f. inornata]|uniref:Uncharacterized protein n=1 Tax=Triparma laevis f. inornata TaxID=1714386 RepID=A0A9W6Z7K1_9STRA|nr:hypothetical protein TL16_g00009 [Triparma laevis f. inornata]
MPSYKLPDCPLVLHLEGVPPLSKLPTQLMRLPHSPHLPLFKVHRLVKSLERSHDVVDVVKSSREAEHSCAAHARPHDIVVTNDSDIHILLSSKSDPPITIWSPATGSTISSTNLFTPNLATFVGCDYYEFNPDLSSIVPASVHSKCKALHTARQLVSTHTGNRRFCWVMKWLPADPVEAVMVLKSKKDAGLKRVAEEKKLEWNRQFKESVLEIVQEIGEIYTPAILPNVGNPIKERLLSQKVVVLPRLAKPSIWTKAAALRSRIYGSLELDEVFEYSLSGSQVIRTIVKANSSEESVFGSDDQWLNRVKSHFEGVGDRAAVDWMTKMEMESDNEDDDDDDDDETVKELREEVQAVAWCYSITMNNNMATANDKILKIL